MSLTPEAFLTRYLAHIPVPRLQTVRGYGLYGQRQRAALDQVRASLGQTVSAIPISGNRTAGHVQLGVRPTLATPTF